MLVRKKRKKSSLRRKAAITAAVVGVGVAGHFSGRYVMRKKAAIRVATRAARESIVKSKLAVDPNAWAPLCRIYKFDPSNVSTRKFIKSVEGFCTKKKLSLKRFFLTVEQNKISQGQTRALENANRSYRKRIEGYKLTAGTKKGIERRFAESQIKKLGAAVERNTRIQEVIEFCLKYPKQAAIIHGTRGSLREVKGLPNKKGN